MILGILLLVVVLLIRSFLEKNRFKKVTSQKLAKHFGEERVLTCEKVIHQYDDYTEISFVLYTDNFDKNRFDSNEPSPVKIYGYIERNDLNNVKKIRDNEFKCFKKTMKCVPYSTIYRDEKKTWNEVFGTHKIETIEKYYSAQ